MTEDTMTNAAEETAEEQRKAAADAIEKIQRLKKEKNAVVLAHYYQPYEIQELADIVGDSLELARKCTKLKAETVVFCGVRFMGESAALLCPGKKVLLPAPDAPCLLADTLTPKALASLKAAHPESAVVCYINSSAAVKALSDVCCTSANAVKVVKSLKEDSVIFVPDRNLGDYAASQVPEKRFFFHESGCCAVHDLLSAESVAACKARHPNAPVLAHPECSAAVRAMADFIGSTSQMIRFCEESGDDEYIICTESGVTERLSHLHPEKRFHIPDKERLLCPGMKEITVEKLLFALENETGEVLVDEALRKAALRPIEKMLEI